MNKTSLALAILGSMLGIGALWGFFVLPSDAGDEDAILEGLMPPLSTTSTTISPFETATPHAVPAWRANAISQLDSLDGSNVLVPTGLIVESLGIDAPVGPYGVDSNGQMDVPNNVADVAWYKYGVAPGEPGSAVLAAHVDLSGPGRGLFWDLHKLELGSLLMVEYADGTEMGFEVVARTTYLKDEFPVDAIFSEDGPSVLTLITCGGGFSRSEGSYDSNVVVYAVPVGAADTTNKASGAIASVVAVNPV